MKRKRTVLRAVLASVLVLVVLAAIVGGVLFSRLTAEPAWWTPELEHDAAAADLGEEAEKGMTRVLSRERGAGESWTIALTQEQANAWLATRFERWARSQHAGWPVAVRGVRVSFDVDAVTIGVAFDAVGSTRYASVTLAPERGDDGRVRVRAASARVGVQSVPMTTLRSVVSDYVPDDALPIGVARAIRDGAGELPEWYTLDTDRRVRIADVVSEEGRLLVTCEAGVGS